MILRRFDFLLWCDLQRFPLSFLPYTSTDLILKEVADSASVIYQTISQNINLIHDLLEQEYLDSSQTALKVQRVELIEQLESLLEGFRLLDQDAHKHFELRSSSPQVFVRIDQVSTIDG